MAKKKKTVKKVKKNPLAQLMKQAVTWTSLTKMLKLKPNGVKLFRVDDTGTAVFTIYAVKNKHMFYSSETKFYGVSSELTDLFFQKPKIAKAEPVVEKVETNKLSGDGVEEFDNHEEEDEDESYGYGWGYEEDLDSSSDEDEEDFEEDDLPKDAVVVDGPQLN